ATDGAHLEVEVMLVGLGPELDLLDGHERLVLARLFLLLRGLVLELAVIHDAAHRRYRLGRDLDQVESGIFGGAQGFDGRHDAELRAVRSDDPHLGHADAAVDSIRLGWGCAWLGYGLLSLLRGRSGWPPRCSLA